MITTTRIGRDVTHRYKITKFEPEPDSPERHQRYLALGGTHSQQDLRAYLSGDTGWSTGEHDAAAHALNEYFTDHGLDHLVAYADEIKAPPGT